MSIHYCVYMGTAATLCSAPNGTKSRYNSKAKSQGGGAEPMKTTAKKRGPLASLHTPSITLG